jgi:hypothetical protein
MKEFKLNKILLLSLKEQKAKKVIFDPIRTIILGRNSTGKSCLIKSIYQTFGAEPQNIHPNWKEANAISLVHFTIDGEQYSIIRSNKVYCLFNSLSVKIEQFNKVSELGIYLAKLFDFKIQLPNKEGEIVTPPPAYLFLPYYADQDKSWTSNWNSFSKLYLPNAKLDIINYHTGIRPNKYYEAKNELGIVNDGIQVIEKDITIVKSLLKNLKEKLSQIDFSISIDDFQEEIKELLIACEELNKIQNKHKHDLTLLYNQKINLEAQLEITQRALIETSKDYAYAINEIDDNVHCPSCGADYENNFAERFGIAQDEQRCLDLILELKEDISVVEKKIGNINIEFNQNNQEIAKIEKLLESKKETIKLKDVIESEGRKEMKLLFEAEIKAFETELKEKLLLKSDLEKEVKTFEDKKRASDIRAEYRDLMGVNLRQLNVHSLDEKHYKRIDSSIQESGSAMPRALMAYYYSILNIIKGFGSSAFCPIIIDSPNQQGQDKENLPRLINFIIDKQPKDSQLILGLEEIPDGHLNEHIIELKEERSLLQVDEYEEVLNEIKPYLKEIIG